MQTSLDRLMQSDEALLDWNLLTENGAKIPEKDKVYQWYKKWIKLFHGLQLEVMAELLTKDYFERQRKYEELGPEKYTEWIDEIREKHRKENAEAIKIGAKQQKNDIKLKVGAQDIPDDDNEVAGISKLMTEVEISTEKPAEL